jgi:ABC-type Na+ efflux pump permease subunit
MDDRKSLVAALVLAASGPSATPVALLIGFGVVVGIFGHLAGSRRTVVAGLAVLFVATALLIAGAYLSYSDDDVDPRPCDAPGSC